MATGNPFTPGFGEHPPVLAGRDESIGEMLDALVSGPPTRKEYVSVLLGPRGAGKTTMLASIADEARSLGWRVIQVDTPFAPSERDGVLAELRELVYEHLDDIDPAPKRRFAGFSIPLLGGGVRWDNRASRAPTTKKMLRDLVKATEKSGGAGVLLAMDEFHNMTPPEASQIAGAIEQITKIQKRRMAFIGAALPHIEHTLLREEGFTFFHRGARRRVGRLSLSEAIRAIGIPLRDGGISIADSRLEAAAEATRGLAYSTQSVGYHLWEIAGPPPAEVTDADLADALVLMRADVDTHVAAPIWSRLSSVDRLFLGAMLSDSRHSTLAAVTKRLGSELSNPSMYKDRLLQQGAIIEIGRELHFASDAIRDRAAEERDIAAIQDMGDLKAERIEVLGPSLGSAPQQVCGEWMPVAKVRCGLPRGHKGNHRRPA